MKIIAICLPREESVSFPPADETSSKGGNDTLLQS